MLKNFSDRQLAKVIFNRHYTNLNVARAGKPLTTWCALWVQANDSDVRSMKIGHSQTINLQWMRRRHRKIFSNRLPIKRNLSYSPRTPLPPCHRHLNRANYQSVHKSSSSNITRLFILNSSRCSSSLLLLHISSLRANMILQWNFSIQTKLHFARLLPMTKVINFCSKTSTERHIFKWYGGNRMLWLVTQMHRV